MMDYVDTVRGLAIAECLRDIEDADDLHETALEAYRLITSPLGKLMIESMVSATFKAPNPVQAGTRFEMN